MDAYRSTLLLLEWTKGRNAKILLIMIRPHIRSSIEESNGRMHFENLPCYVNLFKLYHKTMMTTTIVITLVIVYAERSNYSSLIGEWYIKLLLGQESFNLIETVIRKRWRYFFLRRMLKMEPTTSQIKNTENEDADCRLRHGLNVYCLANIF